MRTLLGAVWNFNPVMSEMASATLTSKPFLVFNPYDGNSGRVIPVIVSIWLNGTACGLYRLRWPTHSSDGGTTLSQHAQPRDNILDTLDTVGDLLNVSTELLTKSQGGSVLQMSSTDLDDRLELGSLSLEGIVKLVESG
jgi:hypothetical protein